MVATFTTPQDVAIMDSDKGCRTERDILNEQLRLCLNMKAQAGNMETLIRRRLAEIERATAEKERLLLLEKSA